MLKISLPSIKISVTSTNETVTRPYKKNGHIFTRSLRESESCRLTQRYHEQDDDRVYNCQIYNWRVQISAWKLFTLFSNATVDKEFASWASGYVFTRHFCSTALFNWNRTQSCGTHCTTGRLFHAPKVTISWIPDRLVALIRKIQPVPSRWQNLSVFETLSFEMFRSVSRERSHV